MSEHSNLVLGTAGHVDHGKSTLIEALTGIKTDTTEEEHRRGLSIDLGFAYLTLPNGQQVGIIDVPGHEKFLKNMLAGAPGVDLVLLVVDVNEGVMPQTIEHASILSLLGIENFIIVLTKVKGIDSELKEIVCEDIREQFLDTPLSEAPIIETDAVEGLGLNNLLDKIQERCEVVTNTRHNLPARLNVDRSFSVKGFGTVVTGTLIDGSLQVGDEISIYPAGIKTKIRSIQKHNKDTDIAYAGNRTALNLTKVSLNDVQRGDILSTVPLINSYMLDVKVKCLPESPFALNLWDRVHVHIGTQEVRARIVPIGSEAIGSSEEGYLQLRLEEKVCAKKGDHFILRSFSPVSTIAGGVILEENPKKHKRFDDSVIEKFKVKETGDLRVILLNFLNNISFALTSEREMASYLNIEINQLQEIIKELVSEGKVLAFGHQYISVTLLKDFEQVVVDLLTGYHETYPVRAGMPLEEFRSKFNHLSPKDRDALIKYLDKQGVIVLDENHVRLSTFNTELKDDHEKIKNEIENRWKEAGFLPPKFDEIAEGDKTKEEIIRSMIDKELFRLDKHVYLHREVYEIGKRKTIDFINKHGKITLADFRDMMDTSRKYAVLMLEHLDAIHITERVDDYRVLKK